MNQTQIRYARERAKAIYERRIRDLRVAHTIEAKTLTADEKLAALKAGSFTIKPAKERSRYDNWHASVIFKDEIKGGLAPAYETEKAQIDAAYTKLIDELVLGDNEQALRLLEAFDA